ncbi:MAG: tetratricopeptide repeat protein [Planctomycetaceae bacterium]
MKGARPGAALALVCAACAVAPREAEPPPTSAGAEAARQGDALRRRGQFAEAGFRYAAALASDPGSVRAHLGLQAMALARGEDLALRRRYRGGPNPYLEGRLEGSQERQESAFRRASAPWRTLGLAGVEEERGRIEQARRGYLRTLEADPGNPWARAGLARCLLAEGRLGAADAAFETGAWLEPESPAWPLGRSIVSDRRGDLEAALVFAIEAFRRAPAEASLAERLFALATRGGGRRPMERALAALVKGEGSEGVAPALAARLCGLLGAEAYAEELRARALREGASEAEMRGGPDPPHEPFSRFVDALRTGVKARYRHYASTKEAESLRDYVAWARALYERETGRPLLGPPRETAYAFVGRMLDPTASSDDPLVRACAQEGYLLVLGQRIGGPPEAMLARIELREPRGPAGEHAPGIERERVIVREPEVPGYLEWAGGGDLAGIALDRFVVIDLDAVARWQADLERRARRLREGELGTGAGEALPDRPFTSLEDPAGVEGRLLRAGPIRVLEEVQVHEDAHLLDAEQHLPVGRHALRNLLLALGRGFSADAIQAYLERNAQLRAVCSGPAPHAAVAVCVAALGSSGPHARGYREILEGLVGELAAHPELYPEVDPHRVLLQQLHQLPAERLRAAARAVARRWGLMP